MGCGETLMKTILIAFNTIFLLVGGAAIGLGAWLIVDSKDLFAFLDYDPGVGTSLLKAAAYVFIACGCIVVLLAIFGICGACMMNKCMLGTYTAIMVIILIAEIAAIIMIAVYTSDYEEDFKTSMTKFLKEQFEKNAEFKQATQKIQVEMKCCGIEGGKDYTDVGISVNEACVGVALTDRTTGCYTQIKDEFIKHKGVIIGVACGILVFEFILIVFAICLCRSKGKNYGI